MADVDSRTKQLLGGWRALAMVQRRIGKSIPFISRICTARRGRAPRWNNCDRRFAPARVMESCGRQALDLARAAARGCGGGRCQCEMLNKGMRCKFHGGWS